MTRTKVIYEVLVRYNNAGEYQGAHVQFREVVLDGEGVMVSERLLPPVPFGSDPDFPASTLLGQITSDALSEASVQAAAAAAATDAKEAAEAALVSAQADLLAAQQEAAAAAATIAQLQAALNPPAPSRPEGKWWTNAVAFLSEFTATELQAIHTSPVPDITKLLLTLLAWPGEVWSADQRIALGLQALVSTGIISPERRTEILAKPTP